MSSTNSLVRTPGSSDFRIPPTINMTDMTVQAQWHHSLRIRPAFEIRIPIQKTISKSGVLGLGGINCRNVESSHSEKEQVLRCNITNILVTGSILFNVIYNCNIIKTIPVQLNTDSQTFDIALAIYNRNATAHICTEHGICTTAVIGRDIAANPIFMNPTVVVERNGNLPSHISNPIGGSGLSFKNMWGIFSFSSWWHYVVTPLLCIAGIFALLLVYKIVTPLIGCFKWLLPKKRRNLMATKRREEDEYYYNPKEQKPVPCILRPKPSISNTTTR